MSEQVQVEAHLTIINMHNIESDAVHRIQRIYYRSTGVQSNLTGPNTWLSTSGTGYDNWSTSAPKLTDTNNVRYPYLYTCTQTQTIAQAENNGTSCTCSTVLLDDTTTEIDGGTIVTGSIAANKLNIYDANIQKIRADSIDTNSISIGQSQVIGLTGDLTSAAQQATNYLTTIPGTNGISVHSINDTSNYINIAPNTVNIVTNGESRIQAYLDSNDNNLPKIRIGTENAMHSIFSSNGMNIFNENSVVASFSSNGIQIGKDSESHLELDYHSLKFIDKNGAVYMHISDLRDTSGYATVTEFFYGDGTRLDFNVNWPIRNLETTTVSVEGSPDIHATSVGSYTSVEVIVNTAPPADATVTIVYQTDSDYIKAYTLGKRLDNSFVGAFSFAEGCNTTASGNMSHAEGYTTIARGYGSHAEGHETVANGKYSHSEGDNTTANGYAAHTEGYNTTANDYAAHAEGYNTTASGSYSHAEGYGTTAENYSHAEGTNTTAQQSSHAEGRDTTAIGYYSHAEGYSSYASNMTSHSEGSQTRATGYCSHAEGYQAKALGTCSHAQNNGTDASGNCQTALGKFNVVDNNNAYAVIVGNGTADDARSNALTVDWDGKVKMGQILSIHSLPSSSAKIDTSTNNGAISSAVVFGRTEIMDKNGTWVSTYGSNTQTNGQTRSYIGCNNMKADGTMATNYLNIGVNKDGSAYYAMTSPTAFRNAINALSRVPSSSTELPNCTATSNVFPIVLGNSFANNGEISYMSPANFRNMIGAAMYDFYQATGGSGTISTTAGTITPITLVTTGAVSNGSGFSISGGGIKVANAGKYRVTASIYILGTNATFKGVYVKKNNNSTGGTGEVMGLHYPYTASGVQVGPKVLSLAANDVLYLCGRSGGVAGTIYTSNAQTYLLVERIA